MPRVRFQRVMEGGEVVETVVEVAAGENLRRALLRASVSTTDVRSAAGEAAEGEAAGPLGVHNGAARWINCRGFGTCGTCAVEVVEGEVPAASLREAWRLDFPPHVAGSHGGRLRLACCLTVDGDMLVRKHPGFWGQEHGDGLAAVSASARSDGAEGEGKNAPGSS